MQGNPWLSTRTPVLWNNPVLLAWLSVISRVSLSIPPPLYWQQYSPQGHHLWQTREKARGTSQGSRACSQPACQTRTIDKRSSALKRGLDRLKDRGQTEWQMYKAVLFFVFFPVPLLFNIYWFAYLCMACTLRRTPGSQETACRSEFSPTLWVLGI